MCRPKQQFVTECNTACSKKCEAFRSTLANMFSATHPSVLAFLNIVKDTQITTYVDINTKTIRKTLNSKFVKRQQFLSNIKSELETKKCLG